MSNNTTPRTSVSLNGPPSTPQTPKSTQASSSASPLLKSLVSPHSSSPASSSTNPFLQDSQSQQPNDPSSKSNSNPNPNNTTNNKKSAFTSLSPYSQVFKSKIIEEFVIIDSGGSAITSATNVTDLFEDNETLSRALTETPTQLVRFAPIRRINKTSKTNVDLRLLRVSSKRTFPVGVWAAWLMKHRYWKRLITFLILFDAVLLGLQVELGEASENQYNQAAKIIDQAILVVFCLEICIKWLDSFRNFWRDGWNVFDFGVTLMSTIPEFIAFAPTGSIGLLGDITKQLRSLRVLRFLKTIARFPALRIIVSTIFKTFQAMAAIVQLLLIIMFIYAIFGMRLFELYTESSKDDPDMTYGKRFADIGTTIFTLFQLFTYDHWFWMLTEIKSVINPIIASIYIISWVFLSALLFRNIFIGVMVNNFSDISDKVKKREKQRKQRRQMEIIRRRLYKELNANNMTLQGEHAPKTKGTLAGQHAVDIIQKLKEAQQTKEQNLQESFVALQAYLANRPDGTFLWDKNMEQLLDTIVSSKSETLWYRDVLFKYFLTMEQLQENMKEYEELMKLAALALSEIHDT